MNLHFEQLFDEATSTFTYLVADTETREAALIDTVREHTNRYISLIKAHQLNLKYLIETHIHADHITANSSLKQEFPNAEIAIQEKSGVLCPHLGLSDGQKLFLGNIEIQAIATPGHTQESMCFLVDGNRLLTGDTLLIGACGRTDFQGGNTRQMFESLKKISRMANDILVYPAHDYNSRRISSLSEQKATNKLLNLGFEEFKAEIDSWNLPPPKRIAESVPANLQCGVC